MGYCKRSKPIKNQYLYWFFSDEDVISYVGNYISHAEKNNHPLFFS